MVIVDTSIWIDYLRGIRTPETDWLDREMDRRRLGLTDLILCEVLQGVRDDRRFEEVRGELFRLEIFQTGGAALAVAAARNYRRLRAAGWTIRRTVDCLIATFCLMEDHELLRNDRDFDPFERALGLRVIHP